METVGASTGIVISSVNIAGGTKVLFDPRGIPHDENFVPLSSDGVVTLEYQGRIVEIHIKPETGNVVIQ